MGVPGFFGWLLRQYKKNTMLKHQIDSPINILYIDANCLIHPQCRTIIDNCKNIYDIAKLESKMFQRICNYLNFLFSHVNPTDEFFIAVDGSAPLAKINQQRKRRIRTIDDTKVRNEIKKKYKIEINDTWDNTKITPGTEFMERLHKYFLGYINELSKKHPKVKITYSSYHTSGEGEHKILDDIRYQSKNNSLFENKNISIYGLDADLIFLALSSKKNNIYLLREADQFGNNKIKTEIYDIITDVSEELIYLSIDEMRKCYIEQIIKIIKQRDNDIEINDDKLFANDFVVLCYFLGNDFLPHFPSIDIKRNGLDMLLDAYVDTYLTIKLHLIDDNNNLNQYMLTEIIRKMGNLEEEYFCEIKPKIDKRFEKRQCLYQDEYQKEIWKLDNLKDIKIDDPIKFGEGTKDLWKYRYYEHYFMISEYQKEFIKTLCKNYLEGLVWVTKYYFEGCSSWTWHYPFSHAPFISDLYEYINDSSINDINKITFNKDKPLNPCVQLLAVLPKQCNHELPKKYRHLVTSENSPIIDMYPDKVELDLIHKDMLWQAIPFMPYLDITRINNTVNDIELDSNEKERNNILDNFIITP